MSELKIGIVGCGFISENHLRAWEQVEGAKVVALCDIDEERLGYRARQFKIEHTYADVQEMLEKECLNVLDVTTPKETHRNIVNSAAAKRAHVLCQKPFAPTLEDGKAMVDECRRNNVKLMVHQNFRWHPWFAKIKELLAAETLGPVFYANGSQRHAAALRDANGDVPVLKVQPFYADTPRLVLFEMAYHYVDLLRYFFGDVESVYARTANVGSTVKGEELVSLILNFRHTIGVVEVSWASIGEGFSSRTRLEGPHGTIFFDGEQNPSLKAFLQDMDAVSYDMPQGDYFLGGFIGAQRHFAECIREDKEPVSSGEDNLNTLATILSAYESAERNALTTIS